MHSCENENSTNITALMNTLIYLQIKAFTCQTAKEILAGGLLQVIHEKGGLFTLYNSIY